MGCTNIICGKETYDYVKEERLLENCLREFSFLNKCYSHDFVTKCYKNLILNPDSYILKYEKKLEPKQVVPHTILEKWKLILYGTNIDKTNYVDCIGFDKKVEEERIASKTYRFSKRNPFEIRLQDLYFHESYRQIEKDSGRVYLVPQIKQELFEKLLKKVANHFPESGYSLGMNYIIGYFLLVGMSEMDSFWMLIHLVLNEKFLALGFFENEFPLRKVIVEIFKNILRRKNKELYNHIYKNLEVDDASWIEKWVTSFFLSTFPIEFCHYILDYVFTFGILGLAVVSFGIVNFFQNLIFKCEEFTDFILLFQKLLNFHYISHSVPISQFMSSIYEVSLQERDFDLLGEIGDNFYVQYFILYSEWKFKSNKQCREKMDDLLSEWYQENIKKRENFTKMAKSFDGKFFDPNESMNKIDESQSFTNTNLEVTKEEKMAEKSNIEPSVVFQNLENLNIKIPEEMRISYLDNVQTIKVSSRNVKNEQNSNEVESDEILSEESVNFSFTEMKQDLKKLKSEKFFHKDYHYNERKIKSEGNEVQNEKNSDIFKEKSERLSIKSFSHLDKVSENSIAFNENPLSKEISKRLILTQTLPMRNQNLTYEGLENKMEIKTLNSSDNLILFLNKLDNKNEEEKMQNSEEKAHEKLDEIQVSCAEEKIDQNRSDPEEAKEIQFFKTEIKTLKELESLFEKPNEEISVEEQKLQVDEEKKEEDKKPENVEESKEKEENVVESQHEEHNGKKEIAEEENEENRTIRISFSTVMLDYKVEEHFN